MTMYEEDMKQLKEIQAFLELTQPPAINKRYQTTLANAISALKTLEDMGTPVAPNEIDLNGILTIKVNPNVSRETLEEIANYDCFRVICNNCQYKHTIGCIPSLAKHILVYINKVKEN